MNNEPHILKSLHTTAINLDWEVLRNSQPSDYEGATGFAQMSAHDRLRWLDMAVDFVVRYRRFDRQEESV
jgi:hypothetical protein